MSPHTWHRSLRRVCSFTCTRRRPSMGPASTSTSAFARTDTPAVEQHPVGDHQVVPLAPRTPRGPGFRPWRNHPQASAPTRRPTMAQRCSTPQAGSCGTRTKGMPPQRRTVRLMRQERRTPGSMDARWGIEGPSIAQTLPGRARRTGGRYASVWPAQEVQTRCERPSPSTPGGQGGVLASRGQASRTRRRAAPVSTSRGQVPPPSARPVARPARSR